MVKINSKSSPFGSSADSLDHFKQDYRSKWVGLAKINGSLDIRPSNSEGRDTRYWDGIREEERSCRCK